MSSRIPPEQLANLAKEDQGLKTLGLIIAFTVLALTCVILRLFARIRYTQVIGWEDYLIGLSMAFSIITAICQIKQVEYGNGKHQILVDLPSTIISLKVNYCVGFTITKISILTQYLRIFSLKEARLPIYIALAICVATGTAALFTFAFACVPVDALWDVLKKPNAKRIDEYGARYAHGSLNIATELLIAALPVKRIWRLQLVKKQKIALIAVLSLGWLVCILSVVRVHSLSVLARNGQDAMFYGAPPAYWAAIEMNLVIVCAYIPALKPLVANIIPDFSSQQSGNNSDDRPRATKASKPRHSFLRLDGKVSSSAIKSVNTGQGSRGVELGSITELPAAHQRQNLHGGHIRITHELHQQADRRPSNSSSQQLVLQERYHQRDVK